ncbi:MAG TPA: DMT family transporter [Thermotogota bacterium]|nr:DMT family transporter [Thermotogota bacterium]HPJ87626.1 DMT family transporter [Thermotogota bacterium]HPR94936.1 DMT family transporter [Thermotogota bacterium]
MKAILYLLMITLIWGTTFPLQKFVLAGYSPFVFNAIRFWLAAFFSLFFTRKHVFKDALLLGIVFGFAYLTQTWGITLTTASKSGFLTSLYIVIVPIFAFFIEGERIKGFQKIGFPLAFFGSYLLAGGIEGLNLGDILNIICGILFALHIVLITRASKKHDEMSLLSVQFMTAAIINSFASIGSDWTISLPLLSSAVYLALFPTMIALIVQLKYQKKVGNNVTALIFLGEPVFSTLFAILFLQEQLSLIQWTGAFLLIAAILFASLEKNHDKIKKRLE